MIGNFVDSLLLMILLCCCSLCCITYNLKERHGTYCFDCVVWTCPLAKTSAFRSR
ncbi:hypothetical protein AtEden1_Chr2g0241481 [Arabidopsis thaliana]